jgi:hypothetical protein
MIYKNCLKKIKEFGELKTKVLMFSKYKGKGRPKNSDYVICKIKDVRDVKAVDLLECGFNTNYLK